MGPNREVAVSLGHSTRATKGSKYSLYAIFSKRNVASMFMNH